jgi:multidrug resistance efflux pump
VRWGRYLVAALVAVGIGGVTAWSPWHHIGIAVSAPPPRSGVFAAPGRIEGRQTAIAIGAGATGIVQKVFVSEGQEVAKGQVLARLECDDLASEVPEREADARASDAHAEVVRLGPRNQEINASAAELRLAAARLVEGTEARRRSATLAETGAGSRARLTESERDERMAAAQRDAARERFELLAAGARPEEVAEAQARAEAARGAYREALARLARCDIRSPISGVVLRRMISVGELVSLAAPEPTFIIADTSCLRVRVEVDEEDADRLMVGQAVTVLTARGQGLRHVGHVVEVGRQMGRRRITTNDPAERSDRDVLEGVVELASATAGAGPLPVGFRVSVLFEDAATPIATWHSTCSTQAESNGR